MQVLAQLDWMIVVSFFVISLAIGIYAGRSAGKSAQEFFLSGRNMPWWLLGVSMVATTFAADTPGLVTQIVRENGVKGNWVWWAFLLTGMLTVFFYAKLWRKSGIATDLEFYELRYSGKAASFLRGFRAIYLGVIFNVITMAGVCMAGIKIAHITLGFSPVQTLVIAGSVTVIYSSIGGLKSVLLTDFFQFIIAMVGSIWATYYLLNLPEVGGLQALISHPSVQGKLSFLPDFSDASTLVPLFVIPIAVQWWSVWYPGAEPGGGGYIAQRMLAAKSEKHATWAVLFFNFAHYALRPWPWILVGLASLIIYPDIASLKAQFAGLPESYYKGDLAYSAMITLLPVGLVGLVVTSLIAAFMSTISTQLNWGSSYVVNDVYKRFVNKEANEKQQVLIGRITTILLMFVASILALFIDSAKDIFDLLLQVGAGTGLLFILRWFWNRINPFSEIAAMVVSFVIAVFLFVNGKMENPLFKIDPNWLLLLNVGVTTIAWILVTLLTPPSDKGTLANFEKVIFNNNGTINKFEGFRFKIVAFFAATLAVYSLLFATGYVLYGQWDKVLIASFAALSGIAFIWLKRKQIFN